jgi:glycosyltransferase involved in cell wall biosynthesis
MPPDETLSPDDPVCSVVVPAYNERRSLRQLTEEVEAAFASRSETFELLFVDDGSTDGTWDELNTLGKEFKFVRAIRLRRNFGKSAALSAGVDAARGRTLVTLDGDLQDDPAEIPRFLEMLGDCPRLVVGWKVERKDPLGKRLPSKLFNAVTSRVSGVKLHDHNCGYKAAPIECYRSIPLYGELHRFIPALANDIGYEVVELGVRHRAREHGRSKFGLERYVRGFLDLITVIMLTRYRRRPGHLLGGLAVSLGFVGLAILTYLTIVWFTTDQPVGTRPLLMLGILLTLVSVQLFSLGVIAELVVNRSERTAPVAIVADELA